MSASERVTAADVQLMQGLAQRVTSARPDLVNSDATLGELAWNWGKGHASEGDTWRRRLWFSGEGLVAWGWAHLPHRVWRSDGSASEVTSAYLAYQVHPDHAALVDEVIGWYGAVAAHLERTVTPVAGDTFALARWAAHGYETDPASLGDTGHWTQLNQRDLADLEAPVLPDGFRFRTAGEAGPERAVQAHVDAWAPSTYTAEAYEGVRRTAPYRSDLHVLVEAPDRNHGRLRDHVARRGQPDGRVRARRHASRLPPPGARHGDAPARDAPGTRGGRDAHDGLVPGGARVSERARPVLQGRIPQALAGRTARPGRGLNTGDQQGEPP